MKIKQKRNIIIKQKNHPVSKIVIIKINIITNTRITNIMRIKHIMSRLIRYT